MKIIKTIRGSVHVLLSIGKSTCITLGKETKVILGSMRYKVSDTVDILQCWNCLKFDHTVKRCPEPLACQKCGGQGHLARRCTSEKTLDSCMACDREKIDHEGWHHANSPKCMAKKIKENQANEDHRKLILKIFNDARKEINSFIHGSS